MESFSKKDSTDKLSYIEDDMHDEYQNDNDLEKGYVEGEEEIHGQIRKRERRSKEDGSQRNYVCGCGKSYLSYAALYTHAKTKHDGQFPEGTTTLHKKKQGRPKI